MSPLQSETLLSVVSPVYGSPGAIPELCRRLHATLGQITDDYEIVLVFDCSSDDGWQRIWDESRRDSRVKGLRLSRNFGQHAAITAGLSRANGQWIIVMDCDLQDQPEEILKLVSKAKEGYKVVMAERRRRQDKLTKRLTSKFFHAAISRLAGARMDHAVANFGVYHRSVIDAYLDMNDRHRILSLFVQWLGFPTARVPVDHAARSYGQSGYDFRKRFKLAINTMISFSNKPLEYMVTAGFAISALSFALIFYYLARYSLGYIQRPGFTTLVLSIWLVGGLLMMCMGVLGVYVGRIFDQTKGRPRFIIDETTATIDGQGDGRWTIQDDSVDIQDMTVAANVGKPK